MKTNICADLSITLGGSNEVVSQDEEMDYKSELEAAKTLIAQLSQRLSDKDVEVDEIKSELKALRMKNAWLEQKLESKH